MSTARDQSLYVARQEGQGPPVFLVHGAMDRSVSFGRTARRLAGREVVRYDRRGYARSRSLGAGALDAHVADLVGLVGRVPCVLVGHSVGGVVALATAAVRPTVLGVLAYEAPSPWAPWWPRPEPEQGDPSGARPDPADEAEAFMRRMVGDRIWKQLGSDTRAERRAEGEALRADLAMVEGSEPPFDVARIDAPVVAASGTESRWWHRRAAEDLAAAAPNGRWEQVEGADHGVHLTHPERLADLIGGLLHQVT